MLCCVGTPQTQRRRTFRKRRFLFIPSGLLFGLAGFLLTGSNRGAEPEQCQKLFLSGEYDECVRLAKEALKERWAREEWSVWLSKALLETGRYPEASTAISSAMTQHRRSLPVRVLAHEVFLQNGQADQAKEVRDELNQLGASRRYSTSVADLVSVGQAALLLGADPRLVLENFFHEAKKADPQYRETYLAIGQLALDKGDSEIAAKNFQEGIERFPKDPDMFCGLARAFQSGDRSKMVEFASKALEHNPKHTASLLLMADHLIDAEEYEEAKKTLEKVHAVNPAHPEGWAYRAVLAHLNNEPEPEQKARANALQYWTTNPRVDHLIGQKLSQKYRFAEGSTYQRQAIRWDGDFLPAKIQLAQDLLRLGAEVEGWKLAEEVHKRDGYDVTAYNLVTLEDSLAKFQALTNRDFVLRMHPHEAAVYGGRALALLQRAKDALCAKYGMEPAKPTMVEIFPEQKDFAVRTFGMPGNEGYLGVCFGWVITANSPASQTANPSNWESMLWHEFCHVVTLGLTKNKMPRWLSEGISVYEERQANPAWGQTMTPAYREMILKGELTPIAELSSAFLTPKDGKYLQFAYYQSSLVVEFLVQKFGLDALKRILVDLGAGEPINPTIEKHTAPLSKIEKEFAEFARDSAERLGSGLEWKKPEAAELAEGDTKWMEKHPKNYWVLVQFARKLLAEKKWEEAKQPLRTLLEHYPDQGGSDSAYAMLAAAHRGLNETEEERQALAKLALIDGEAIEACLRLMELDSTAQNWSGVAANADRYLSVNPLVPPPHRYLARASESLGKPQEAIQSYEILLRLDPPDPAEVHFRLAKLMHESGHEAAKRHVLQALEEAPRFRDAHQLLLTITGKERPEAKPSREPAPPRLKP